MKSAHVRRLVCCLSLVCAAALAQTPDLTGQESQWISEWRVLMQRQIGRAPTAAEEQRALDGFRALMARMNQPLLLGKDGALQIPSINTITNTAPTNNSTPKMEESALAKLLAELPASTTQVALNKRRDGFDINERAFVDPEGRISGANVDVMTSDVTYQVRQPDGSVTIKFLRAGSNVEPIALATVRSTQSGFSAESVTGKRVNADIVITIPRGFLAIREAAMFRYEAGKGLTSIAVPRGYVAAPMQRGASSAPQYVLLEKENATGGGTDGRKGFSELFSAVQHLGATVGIGEKNDYALLDTETGKLFPLNISADGKTVTKLYDCRRKNRAVNVCDKAFTTESLFDELGTNNRHYFWKVNWHATPQGAVMISHEDGTRRIYATELQTGKKTVLRERTLGIVGFDSKQSPSGAVLVTTSAAFQTEEIADVFAAINAPATNAAKAEPQPDQTGQSVEKIKE
jgi:hypothetical protein